MFWTSVSHRLRPPGTLGLEGPLESCLGQSPPSSPGLRPPKKATQKN